MIIKELDPLILSEADDMDGCSRVVYYSSIFGSIDDVLWYGYPLAYLIPL